MCKIPFLNDGGLKFAMFNILKTERHTKKIKN